MTELLVVLAFISCYGLSITGDRKGRLFFLMGLIANLSLIRPDDDRKEVPEVTEQGAPRVFYAHGRKDILKNPGR